MLQGFFCLYVCPFSPLVVTVCFLPLFLPDEIAHTGIAPFFFCVGTPRKEKKNVLVLSLPWSWGGRLEGRRGCHSIHLFLLFPILAIKRRTVITAEASAVTSSWDPFFPYFILQYTAHIHVHIRTCIYKHRS